MALWRKMILFGDSLTQYSFQEGGWGAIISDTLQRKGDVLNRGFSGYKAEDAVEMMDKVFPPSSVESNDAMTICFGANDASLPGFSQHLPLERYSSCLHAVVKHMVGLGLPRNRIILMSPPAVDEEKWLEHLITEEKSTVLDRRNEVAKQYAEASKKLLHRAHKPNKFCVQVAAETGCIFINLWETFMNQPDVKSCLSDGLHFSVLGNRVVADLLLPHVSLLTENWKVNYPDWKDLHQ